MEYIYIKAITEFRNGRNPKETSFFFSFDFILSFPESCHEMHSLLMIKT